MKKIIVGTGLAATILLASVVSANAADTGRYVYNDRSSSYSAYTYTQNGCKGTSKLLPPGSGRTGAYSVKTYDRSWYIKWSNGNVTSKLSAGYCVNLAANATVYA